MFYEQFIRLCNAKGVSPSAAARAVGLDKSAVSRWAKGSIPRSVTLDRLADYFGVTMGELMGYEPQGHRGTDSTPSDVPTSGNGLEAALEALRNQPGRRALLSATKGMSEAQVLRLADWLADIKGGDKD